MSSYNIILLQYFASTAKIFITIFNLYLVLPTLSMQLGGSSSSYNESYLFLYASGGYRSPFCKISSCIQRFIIEMRWHTKVGHFLSFWLLIWKFIGMEKKVNFPMSSSSTGTFLCHKEWDGRWDCGFKNQAIE